MEMKPPNPAGPAMQWMPSPQPIPGVPAGLERLAAVDQLEIEQTVSLVETFTGWDRNNKYIIRNSSGEQMYYIVEDTDTCMRICCKQNRGFAMNVYDNNQEIVMRVTREFKCCVGCCWCISCCSGCSFVTTVEAPVGNVIGYAKQDASFWRPKYSLYDEKDQKLLKIQGPFCCWDGPLCPCDAEFAIMTVDESQQIGKINKIYGGFFKECTLSDRFIIDFPADLSVNAKAILFGGQFLLDFMFYQRAGDN